MDATMKIEKVTRTLTLTQVIATVNGAKFEYTSHKGGDWEVYDHPKSYRGLPRFCGYMPRATGQMFDVILTRHMAA